MFLEGVDMCAAIALALSELPVELVERYGLRRRVYDRGGEPEVQFHFRHKEPLLPVWHEGQLLVVRWGCGRRDSRVLPPTGWASLTDVEQGRWAQWHAEPVEVPASMGLENGIWFGIRQGIRGVLVKDEQGADVAYLLCEPASHYYQVMTRSDRMPCLIGERI